MKKERDTKDVIMSGAEFLKVIGNCKEEWNDNTGNYELEFENPTKIKHLKKKLRIISRATAKEKAILTRSIKKDGGSVLITGETI